MLIPIIERLPENCGPAQERMDGVSQPKLNRSVAGYRAEPNLYKYSQVGGSNTIGPLWKPTWEADEQEFIEEQLATRQALCKHCLLFANRLCKGLKLDSISTASNGFEPVMDIQYKPDQVNPGFN